MEATFEREGCRFTVLVNHWPSKLGGADQSDVRRQAAAQVARSIVDSLTALDPAADIVLLGDFNDVPSSEAVTRVLDARALDDPASFDGMLINTAAPVERADTIGSYFYRGGWETIDQIMLSRGVLDSAGLVLYQSAENVFAPDFLRDERARSRSPRRTYRGAMYLGGTSDHFPVYLVVEMRPGNVEKR
jgi:predicted extracellular nuclease